MNVKIVRAPSVRYVNERTFDVHLCNPVFAVVTSDADGWSDEEAVAMAEKEYGRRYKVTNVHFVEPYVTNLPTSGVWAYSV